MFKKLIEPFFILTKKNYKRLVFVFLLMIVSIIFDVLSIGILLPLFSEIINNGSTINYINNDAFLKLFNSENLLYILCLIVFFLFFLKNIFSFFYVKISTNYLAYLTIYHQEIILRNFLIQNYSNFRKKSSAEYIREFTSEIQILNANFIQPILTIFLCILTLIGFTILSFKISPSATLFVLIFLLLFVSFFSLFLRKKFIFFGEQRRHQQFVLIKNLQHMFEGIRELKINDKEFIFLKNLKKVFNRIANIGVSRTIFGNLSKIILELILVFTFLITLLTVESVNLYLPIIGVYMATMLRVIPTINLLIRSYQKLNYSEAALVNLIEIYNDKSQKKHDFQKIQDPVNFEKNITFRNISFGHESDNGIFNNANLIIKKNSIIGIKGKSGIGKSTFIDILVGLISPKSGEILVDDRSITNLDKKFWREKFSYIQQNVYTFNESIEVNISLETDIKKIDINKIHEILSLLNLDDLKDKYMSGSISEIGEFSSSISGGQAQRIAIARALYKSPEIIIFDESFNNIDKENKKDIMNLVKEISKNTTIIIISHEDSIFKFCNEIYEIKDKNFKKLDKFI